MHNKIIIIGAGPSGLGAAYHFSKLSHTDWQILEFNDWVSCKPNKIRQLPNEVFECIQGSP
ncbi:hypothetical protein KI809_09520 [Geobacter pelophilus]|uniref:NAD(P)-binding Rossmann-like domain-containing protein n=1 Tax=Geoanaerobacter pelophilus TaxID=60036 RepID=A0AAW4L8B2_9BACT|nr:hypothetical protein [Geoanaerobacter pelophilus]MBT0664536.1 hypothetical protein [Geoanaerobacter pelophilus]